MLNLLDIFHLRKKPHAPPSAPISAALSDIGMVRKENQDAFFFDGEMKVWCVADGMGGGQGGARAARWACEEIEAAFTTNRTSQEDLFKIINSLSCRILDYAHEHNYHSMGTTIALVWMTANNHINVLHVGDSRVYRLRNGRLKQLTRDHTVADTLARVPQPDTEAKTLRSRKNPLSHILTRAIGPVRFVQPETITGLDARRGDRFLLCSDGVHDLIEAAELQKLLHSARTPQIALNRMAKLCRKRGAHDNFTAICFFI